MQDTLGFTRQRAVVGLDQDASFDPAAVLAVVDGDKHLLAELVDIFREDRPAILARLRRSVEAGDARGVRDAAHAIRGMVGNFAAHAACETAQDLEVMGQRNSLAEAGAGVDLLERQIGALDRNLARMAASSMAAARGPDRVPRHTCATPWEP